jgi:tetratricopeptide (TPR) repeat protein
LRRYEDWKSLAASFLARERDHTVAIQLLAESDERIGEARLALGDVPGALAAYREALEAIRPAAEKDPSDIDLQVLLARIQSGLGGALIEAGDLPAARAELEKAKSIQEAVLEKSPKHARAKRGLELTESRLSRT